MTDIKKKTNNNKLCIEMEQMLKYLLQHDDDEIIEKIYNYFLSLFVDKYGNKPTITNEPTKKAGEQRNDLPGSFRVRGNKIYIRYKGKDIATGSDNTTQGWKIANKWWEEKYEEIDAILTGKKIADDTIENIFNKFLEYKKQFQKLSLTTIKLYEYRIKEVFGSDLNIPLNEKNIKLALDNFITSTKLSATSINIILQGISSFLNWASEEDNSYIPNKNYTKKYRQPLQKKIKSPYTDEEYLMFVEHFEKKNQKEMSLFLQFLWNTGARSKETINIKISDIDFKNNYIKMQNKTYKGEQETLLLTEETKAIIEKIIALKKSKDGRLFSWQGSITPFQNLEKLENKLGIKIKGRGLHGFRRSYADKLFESGFDTTEVQDAMRHRTINTTIGHYKSFKKTKLVDKLNEKLK